MVALYSEENRLEMPVGIEFEQINSLDDLATDRHTALIIDTENRSVIDTALLFEQELYLPVIIVSRVKVGQGLSFRPGDEAVKDIGHYLAQSRHHFEIIRKGRQERKYVSYLIEMLSEVIYIAELRDKRFHLLTVLGSFHRLFSISAEEFGRRGGWPAVLGRENLLKAEARLRTIRAGQPDITEFTVETPDGPRIIREFIRLVDGSDHLITGIITDITEKTSIERQLKNALFEVEKASKVKTEFLAAMSHELRTPLNGISGMAGLLGRTELTREQSEYVETIRQSSSRMRFLVSDIFDYSQIELGDIQAVNEDFDVVSLVEQCFDLVSPEASVKKLELFYLKDKNLPESVSADKSRIAQILLNLVSNAVTFTESGYVGVHLSLNEKNMLHIQVEDTGPGVAEKDLPHLFKAFTRGDSSLTRRTGGAGIGLAVCKQLVEWFGGHISYHKKPEGGSIFSFSLPAGTSSQPVAAPVQKNRTVYLVEKLQPQAVMIISTLQKEGFNVEQLDTPPENTDLAVIVNTDLVSIKNDNADIIDFSWNSTRQNSLKKPFSREKLIRLLAEISGEIQKNSEDQNYSASELPLKILIAEDNQINRKLLERLLKKQGYTPSLAVNGSEAVAACHSEKYDLIFMDIHMPGMDGFEASRRIRAELEAGNQPVIIAVTAHVLPGSEEACLEAGMDDFIAKPLRIEEIIEKIRYWGTGRKIRSAAEEKIEDLIDFSIIAQTLGSSEEPDHEFIRELIEMYESLVPGLITEILSGIDADDRTQIRESAHSLKGASLNMGAVKAADISKQIEKGSELLSYAEIRSLITELTEVVNQTVTALSEENR